MNIPMNIRLRQDGRWPVARTLPGDKKTKEASEPRHAKRASGGLDKRRTANTRRRVASGKARYNRGRKHVIESARHGGPYGKTAAETAAETDAQRH